MSKAEQVVYDLLEMDPKRFIMRARPPPLDPETRQFQREAVVFLKYLAKQDSEIDQDQARADIRAISKATDFDAIRAIVAKYETGDFNFMDFINGC
jgi:hypothetical protein